MTDVIAGRFALCDPIARGGSGTVWRAYDRKRQQFCAAKVLRRRDAGDLLRFVREQSVRMSHAHVLTPYSWAAEDAYVVIASELVDGGSLSGLLHDCGPLGEGTVAVVLDQLLVALAEVHRAGLVHRDVKPANLLLRATGTGPLQVMLSDFGLAIGAQDAHLTQAGMIVGTPGYVAPELLRGGVAPDPRHDLYAAGRVAAALAAGVEPAGLGVPTDLSPFPPGPLRTAVAALGALDARARPRSAGEARALLAGAPRDPAPRTRAGTPIDVPHRLPPLTATALRESGADGTDGTGSRGTAAHAEVTASATPPTVVAAGPATLVPAGGTTPALGTAPATGDTRSAVGEAPTTTRLPGAARRGPTRPLRARGRGARRSALVAAAGLLVAAAVAVPTALVVGTTDADPARSTPPVSTPARTTGGSYVPPAVTVNEVCTFTDEGDVRTTGDGVRVRCARQADGGYVWARA
ncbi:serine/threonine protein kinase [Jatrophihabitans endophyticus]|uniref:non-specific serine/threonine protein kinase n=1 Tax=Jatrophihabitans endophyticus TaxID=1206085 RepID=A0A1M5LR92_9ACTN|nr:serine/threonine-protein kinase [Jatrophihabitans endophyticus]SHG67597.1 serine/threonine protein kinase [Jatrophihabitans endophyticus]